MQWTPTTSIDEPHLLTGTCGDEDARWFHGVKFFPTNLESEGEEACRAMVMRLFCHLCIDRIPDMGIRDVYDNLMDSFRFYQLPPARPKARPAAPAILGVFPGEVARRFQIEED